MPRYIRIPERAYHSDLTHAEFRILAQLCLLAFRFRDKEFPSTEFYVTDRNLADLAHVTRSLIAPTKKKLNHLGLITYRIGEKNRTYYRILYD